MAVKAKAKHTSTLRNPGNKTATASAQRSASTATKTNASKKKGSTTKKKKNPTLVTKTYRKKIKRNPNMNSILTVLVTGIASGMGLGIVDTAINWLAPSAGENAQILIKGVGAWAVHTFGGKVPFLKDYKNWVAGLLAMFAGYDVYRYKVAPLIANSGITLPFGLNSILHPQSGLQQVPVLVQQSPAQLNAAPAAADGSYANGNVFWNSDRQLEYFPN